MPGVFGWLTQGLLGEQNPADQMAQFAHNQQIQNRRAIGLDQYGNLLPPPPDPNAPAGAAASPASPQNGTPAQTTAILPPSQTPNAVKSDTSMGELIMNLARNEQRQQGFNQAMGGGFAAISQPRNRGWVSAMFNTQPLDAAKLGQTLMNVGSQQQGQDRANAIGQMVNDPIQGPALAAKLNMDWSTLKAGITTDPGMIGKIAQVLGTPTERQREFQGAQAAIANEVRTAHPDWTPDQVQAEVAKRAPPEMLLSGVGPLSEQEYRQYAAAERAAGRTPMGPVEWNAQREAETTAGVTHAKDVTEQRDAAVLDYPHIDQKLTQNEQYLDKLIADPKATLAALQAWRPTTGKLANVPLLGAPQNVKDAAIAIQQLRAALTGASLSDVRNVRNIQEFNTLGQAATGGLDAANDEASLKIALQTLKNRFATTRAIAREQAGLSKEEAPAQPPPETKTYNPKTGEIE